MRARIRQLRVRTVRGGKAQGIHSGGSWALVLVIGMAVVPSPVRAQDVTTPPDSGAASAPSKLSGATRVPARPGEICIVCGEAAGTDDDAYLIDGQRVAVHKRHCEAKLAEQPARYLARLRPNGSQFMDTMAPNDGLLAWWGWLAIGLYVLAGLVFAGLCGYGALNRSINPIPWFFTGLFLNVFGYLFLLTRPSGRSVLPVGNLPRGMVKIPATLSPRPCPKCGTSNHPAATACIHCRWALSPLVESEVARAGLQHS